MRIPIVTINYDRYWRQLVVGVGLRKIGGCKCSRGVVSWKRLFSIGRKWK